MWENARESVTPCLDRQQPERVMNKTKITLLAAVIVSVALFFIFDLGQYFNLEYLKEKQAVMDGYYTREPLATAVYFFLLYVAITGLSLPGATLLTLAGGAVFGLLWGTVIASFASTFGATLAFLFSRYLFRAPIQERYAGKLAAVNRGMAEDGAFYLFTLRLAPIFPYFVINLVMGLTTIRTLTFMLVSQAGMLAATIVYVNAGTQVAKIEQIKDILSPGLFLSFALAGIFPLLAKVTVDYLKRRKIRR